MILKADISKTSTGRYLFLFIFMCGNSKCTRIQKIKNFSGEVNWVHQALKGYLSTLFNTKNEEKLKTLKTTYICITWYLVKQTVGMLLYNFIVIGAIAILDV